MAYSQTIVMRARARLAQAKADHEQDYTHRLCDAYARYPRLQEIDRLLSATVAQAVAASFRKGEDPSEAIAALKVQNLALQRERRELEALLEEGYLDNSPICTKCGGSGYVGARMCECLAELCRQEQKKELTSLLTAGKASFDRFRLDVYPDTYSEEYGCSPRQMMRLIFNRAQRYANGFTPDSGNMLFTGNPGLGKTFLSACIARTVADKGFSVVYDTAIHVFAEFEEAKFGDRCDESEARTRKYLECDLLIMDDLGSEMTTQFTQSALYTMINTRLMEEKATLISTNLTREQLGSRYSPAICSRILGMYQFMQFLGSDLRRQG